MSESTLTPDEFFFFRSRPLSAPRRRRPRLHPPDPDPGRRDSARARGPRRARLRHDRQRQDRGVPAADPAPAASDKPRGTTRALVLTPTRELAAQILEDLQRPRRAHADHRRGRLRRRRHGAAGARLPQRRRRHRRHARAACSITSGSRTRKLDRPRDPRARRSRPHARHGLPARHPPRAASTCRRSARRSSSARRCRRRSRRWRARCCTTRSRSTSSASSAPAVGITQAVYPVRAGSEVGAASSRCCKRGRDRERARLHAHQAPRQPAAPSTWRKHGIKAERIHGNRSQAQRTEALAGFKSGKYRVLVATDIAARGIDVEALGHVVNFDVPHVAGGLHPPRRPHRARRADRRRLHVRLAGRGRRPARHRARDRQAAAARHARDFDYNPSRRRSSRSRSPSASRRSAASAPTNGRGPSQCRPPR